MVDCRDECSVLIATTEYGCDNEKRSLSPNTTSFFTQSEWLDNSTNIKSKVAYEDGTQYGLNDIHLRIAVANQQRPSVIKWIRKELTADKNFKKAPVITDHLSLQVAEEATASNKTSSSSLNLKHGNEKYRCRFCGKSFKWYSHWQAHERTHTGERPFKCEMCDKAFTRSDGLKCHKLTHVSDVTNRSSWFPRCMSKKCAGDISVPCRHDDHDWTTKDRNTFEQDVHKEAKLFRCHVCGRNISSSAGLINHVRRHKGRREFKCDACNMTFSKQSALEIHSRVHTGLRPYRCSVCGRAFSINGNLKRHLLIHTGERPYTCPKCSSSFNNPSHITRHIKKKHAMANSNP